MPRMIPRPEVEDALLAALETERCLLLTGPRGSGKTTLLERLRERFHGPSALARLEPITGSPEMARTELLRIGSTVWANGASRRSLTTLPGRRAPGSLLLLDDVTELRTLAYYPGVEKPLDSFLGAVRRSKEATILSSRFGFWMRRTFPEWPCRSLPPFTEDELRRAGVPEPELVIAATGGLAVHVAHLAEGDVTKTLARELTPGGRLDAECRATYAELLHRARGYAACKSVLRVLADEEGLSLTEVARRMDRTPGSTRDYLRWLEEVDAIVARKKRFHFVDPILRLWLRIHGRGTPPTPEDVAREVYEHLGRDQSSPRQEPDAFRYPPTSTDDLLEFD